MKTRTAVWLLAAIAAAGMIACDRHHSHYHSLAPPSLPCEDAGGPNGRGCDDPGDAACSHTHEHDGDCDEDED